MFHLFEYFNGYYISIVCADDDNDSSSNIIRDTHNLEKHRAKLLQFHENRRPPYWGTWRKRSKKLNSRRPFAKDKVRINSVINRYLDVT